MAATYCAGCGALQTAGAAFCGTCGLAVGGEQQSPPPSWGTPPGYVVQQARPGTNGLAISSLVLSLVWCYSVGSILAVIFGHIARKQIRERGESGDGMALAGLIIGWVGIGVTVIALIAFAASAGDSSGY